MNLEVIISVSYSDVFKIITEKHRLIDFGRFEAPQNLTWIYFFVIPQITMLTVLNQTSRT